MSSLKYAIPSVEDLHKEVQRVFDVLPCMFQARDAIAQLEQRDCVTISPTGSGKTLTFWIPLLFNDNGIIIVITVLNILGDKNVDELKNLGISAVNITASTATDVLFKVSIVWSSCKPILIQCRILKLGFIEWWSAQRRCSMIVALEICGSQRNLHPVFSTSHSMKDIT
jgi:DEAD/DEAH box helicase